MRISRSELWMRGLKVGMTVTIVGPVKAYCKREDAKRREATVTSTHLGRGGAPVIEVDYKSLIFNGSYQVQSEGKRYYIQSSLPNSMPGYKMGSVMVSKELIELIESKGHDYETFVTDLIKRHL